MNVHYTGPRPSDDEVAADVAYAIVRAYSTLDRLVEQQFEDEPELSPAERVERLQQHIARRIVDMVGVFGAEDMHSMQMLLDEALDNLGLGDALDPEATPGLRPRL